MEKEERTGVYYYYGLEPYQIASVIRENRTKAKIIPAYMLNTWLVSVYKHSFYIVVCFEGAVHEDLLRGFIYKKGNGVKIVILDSSPVSKISIQGVVSQNGL